MRRTPSERNDAKKRTLSVCSLLLFALAYVGSAAAEESPDRAAHEADARKLLRLTTPEAYAKQTLAQLLEPFRKANTEVPAEFWDRFVAKFDVSELIDLTLPIYMRHFTHEDIRGMLAFFDSPSGKKFLEKRPIVARESIAVGQLRGASLAKKVEAELTAEGLR